MRNAFENDLKKLQDDVLILASMVERQIIESVDALRERSKVGSRQIIAGDERINERRFAIENDVVTLIATQQPMAKDLRFLAGVLEIITELERIGDYGKGIAKINLMMGDAALIKPLVHIPVMAEKARSMLHDSLDAFIRQDVALAKSIPARDDEVDELYNQVYREILDLIFVDSPKNFDQATQLLWVAHNLERAADRVTNICERVVFTVTGHMIELDNDERVLAY
ncbi:MAG: phosphate signaling complex protein PhoU [Anaerolineae bacterium]|nr:phosphate signaling complex protein PhoU [Anaerolineae bacterium]